MLHIFLAVALHIRFLLRNMCNIKYINAQQAKTVHSFKNIKGKPLKKNAAMWFNKICSNHQLTFKYINVNDNNR